MSKSIKLTKENTKEYIDCEDSIEQSKLEYWLSKMPTYILIDEEEEDDDETT